MKYRDKVIKVVKIAGQELIDRAEELICNTEGIKDINIWVRIPSPTDDPQLVPEIEVSTNVYPRRTVIKDLIDIHIEEDRADGNSL